jgi:hypothetical protein
MEYMCCLEKEIAMEKINVTIFSLYFIGIHSNQRKLRKKPRYLSHMIPLISFYFFFIISFRNNLILLCQLNYYAGNYSTIRSQRHTDISLVISLGFFRFRNLLYYSTKGLNRLV